MFIYIYMLSIYGLKIYIERRFDFNQTEAIILWLLATIENQWKKIKSYLFIIITNHMHGFFFSF